MNTNSSNISKSLLLSVVLVAALNACSPRTNPDIEHAEQQFTALKRDPIVLANASAEVREAELALHRAKRDWQQSKDEAEAAHLAYLTERKIDIARVKANKEIAEDEAASLSRGRDRALLDARTEDVILAEQKAHAANVAAAHYQARTVEQQAQLNVLRQNLSELQTRETARGLSLTLGDVLFETNRAELKPGATRNLIPLATFLKNQPSEFVTIEGHTDNVGTTEFNRDLSERRALAVRDFLISEGIGAARISARGLGETYPLASNASDAGRLQNRRVEVIVSNGRVAPGRS